MNRFTVGTCVAAMAAFALPADLYAAPVGTAFTYQGRLTSGGQPANGVYDVSFRLMTAAGGGGIGDVQVGDAVVFNDVTLTDGLFTGQLDFGNDALPGEARWLEISIRPGAGLIYTVLSPRQKLTPAPYAVGLALPFEGVTSSANTLFRLVQNGNGPVITGQTFGLNAGAGSFVISNTDNYTDALTGSTNGTGSGVSAFSNGTGFALEASASNGAEAIFGYTGSSTGSIAYLRSESFTNSDAAVRIETNGTGPAVQANGSLKLVNSSNSNRIELKPNGVGDGADAVLRNSNAIGTLVLDADFGADAGKIEIKKAWGELAIGLYGDYGGKGRVVTQELEITGGSDLSEQFDITSDAGEIEPGMVVSIDPAHPGRLRVSTGAYERTVAGIISGAGGVRTGMMMGQTGSLADGAHAVALTGRVYCWCDATTAAIQAGDLLTTSEKPGHAMKVDDFGRASGAVIGKAMTELARGETGLVLVLVNLQ